jgi:GH15 family glucan-1,4-alpha-glucosidase
MYGVDGRKRLDESTLEHFEGYRKSRPVRVGNAAHDQLQLDISGELMDSVYLYNKFGEPISYDFWRNLTRVIDWVCENWQRPDEGIWEVRGGAHEFLYSRVMCWVAIDRGIRLAQKRSFPAPLARWVQIRDQIYRDVYDTFWDGELRTFVQFKGSQTVDASALLMPLVKFIGPNDPRWRSTLAFINENLVEDSLVYRYNVMKGADTGFPGGEGTFSMCSFWNVECLARAGDLKQARFNFEKTLGYANHLGLYSEELGLAGEQLGNFPQAFTHLGLISAAYLLDRKLSDSDSASA